MGKRMYLANGSEQGLKWNLLLTVSPKQREWGGYFFVAKEKRKDKCKTVHLYNGHVEGWKWGLSLSVSVKQHEWIGSFNLVDERTRYKDLRRSNDRYWAETTFPRQWLQQFEIHHRWSDETCYFLTKEEHRKRDREIRYANQ